MAAVFKIGEPVRVLEPPNRTGYVRAVKGSGLNAQVTVTFPGWHPVTYKAYQIEHI